MAALGAVAFVVLLIATGLGTVARYLVLPGFEWSFEVAGFAFVWVTFLGTILAEVGGENVALDLADRRLGPGGRRLLGALRACALLVVAAALLRSGLAMLARTGATPSSVLRVPIAAIHVAVPVCGLALATVAVARLAPLWRARRA